MEEEVMDRGKATKQHAVKEKLYSEKGSCAEAGLGVGFSFRRHFRSRPLMRRRKCLPKTPQGQRTIKPRQAAR